MIPKKNDTYQLIRKNILKLSIIQEATQYSPLRLLECFLKFFLQENSPLNHKSAYKYFNKVLNERKSILKESDSYRVTLQIVKQSYLSADYFGTSYEEFTNTYRQKEDWLKNFVKEAFKATHPITHDMTPSEVARRNQSLGKISVNSYVGDIVHYSYFKDAPGFMIADVERSLSAIDIFIARLLHDKSLDQLCGKLATNEELQRRLVPKVTSKAKVRKI